MSTLIEIADAVKEDIETSIAAAVEEVDQDATVSRVWDVMIQTPEDVAAIDGRNVYVIPMAESFAESANRGQDRNEYTLGILIVQRVDQDLKSPDNVDGLTAKVDALTEWVKDYVFGPLTVVDYAPITGAFMVDAEIREVFNRGIFRQYGLFWSEIDIRFAIDESNT